MSISLALEWFLNPDHLPFIIGIEKRLFEREGIDLNIIEPNEHYDGFEALREGRIEMATNEPLHLIEQFDDNLISLGSFFITRGGVLLSKDGFNKLKEGEIIKISTPASNRTTDKIGFELIRRFMKEVGYEITRDKVVFVQTDFYHIKNIKNGFDGAWLFFYNFEGVEAKHERLELIYIDSTTTDFPNFSALDIYVQREFYKESREDVHKFLKVIHEAIEFIENNREEAVEIYCSYSGEEKTSLLEEIILETTKCFIKDFKSDHSQQIAILEFFRDLKVTNLEVDKFKKAFLE